LLVKVILLSKRSARLIIVWPFLHKSVIIVGISGRDPDSAHNNLSIVKLSNNYYRKRLNFKSYKVANILTIFSLKSSV
jgi:hypothetical protein